MALDFLTTRVPNTDRDDYKKLTHTINYIRATQEMDLTLKADLVDTIQWWIDTAYGMHLDMKGHSGGIMSLGKGAVYSKLSRHRINLRSSTKSDIIGVDNHIPGVLWALRFLGGQGFKVNENII